MKARSKLQAISKFLSAAGIESSDKEAEIILRDVLKINIINVYRDDPELTDEQLSLVESVVSRRTSREPLQYILGHVEFMGLRIQVGKGVLIPRPETELMAEIAIKAVSDQQSAVSFQTPITHHTSPITILDLCTGSGCLALALAKEFPYAQVYGTDISDDALSYAKRNAALNNISNVSFIQGNLFNPFKNPHEPPFSKWGLKTPSLVNMGEGRFLESNFFDLIISNPPYIKTEDVRNLDPEIKNWEPLSAIDGGSDGLDHYRRIVSKALNFLKDNGILMLELGEGQGNAVSQLFNDTGYRNIKIVKDYAGIERIISASK